VNHEEGDTFVMTVVLKIGIELKKRAGLDVS
jgi:hypothetical protein